MTFKVRDSVQIKSNEIAFFEWIGYKWKSPMTVIQILSDTIVRLKNQAGGIQDFSIDYLEHTHMTLELAIARLEELL